jgi:hypothetical protein
MSAESTVELLNAVRARIAAECAGIGGGLAVALTAPLKADPALDVLCYVLDLAAPDDTIKTAGATIQRTHHFELRLWMRTPDDAAETTFLAYADAISSAFYQSQTLGGIATRVTLAPAQAPPYFDLNGTIRRQRVWALTVVQQFTVVMQ